LKVNSHLQINADLIPANHHRNLLQRADEFYQQHDDFLFSSYLSEEKADGPRYIGATGSWQWISAFAPEQTAKWARPFYS
jgi:galactose-1-phosphate uridylyltransferase